jgi:hypothetical protein
MTINYQKFFPPTVLTLDVATIYAVPTSPVSNLWRGARVRLTNTTNSPKTARLYAVPAADSASNGNAFFFDSTVPAFGTIDIDVPILAAGDSLQGNASATPGVNIQAITGGVFSA